MDDGGEEAVVVVDPAVHDLDAHVVGGQRPDRDEHPQAELLPELRSILDRRGLDMVDPDGRARLP